MLRSSYLHSGWELACGRWLSPPGKLGHSTLEWLPATVPGHVHLDLIRHALISDPFEALGELGCQWVDEEDWSYRTEFRFQPNRELPRRALRFEGLDTVCSVFLNGERLASHDNMFVPLEIDVSERLLPRVNELRVDFASAVRTGRERRARYLASEGLADNAVRFDERAFVRKAQYMFGWDWGPRLVSAGFWAPVQLVEYAGRLLDVRVTQQRLGDGSIELCCRSEVEGYGEVWHFVEGIAEPLRDGQILRLHSPELWWPHGLGKPRLYRIQSVLVENGSKTPPFREEQVLDQRTTKVGLRTLRLVREKDSGGESFQFELNGGLFWAVGANWICNQSFPSQVTGAELRKQISRAVDMNMNMLRVWGGGLYETDDFFDACDQLGVLVWQDFPYACSYYPDDPETLERARLEAAVNIRRLRNHPSLAIWCGNNENAAMFYDGWGGRQGHPERYHGERIYHGVLPQILAELDPERPYWPSSPWGGESPSLGGMGDQHNWDVWHGRGDWKHYDDSTARFASEFGFCSAPSLSAWRRMMPRALDLSEVDVRHPIARWHDKTGKGYETFLALVELHYPPAQNLEEWTYYSQLNQRDALRYGIEHYRRSESCRGTLIWQLNDCWPVQSWAVVDAEGVYKAAAYELRRLYAPALVCLQRLDGRVRLWTVLDNVSDGLRGRAELEARSLVDGRLLARWEAELELVPGERRIALEVDVEAFDPERTILSASFLGSSTFRLLTEPKRLKLPCPTLTASKVAGGIALESDAPVVDLWVSDPGGELGLEDNFVTLAGPGRVLLRGSGTLRSLAARSLAGKHTIVISTEPEG